MKPIEPAKLQPAPELVRKVSDFWTRNVNAERIMGRSVSDHERGSGLYFAELEEQRYRYHRHLPAWISSMRPGSEVLEVGCGIGMDSARMAQHGLRVTAVDLTVVGPATANRRAQVRQFDANYLSSDAEHLPFRDSAFDYVYSFGVMHHAPDTQRCIDEAYRVLRPGGQALIMLYHRHSLMSLCIVWYECPSKNVTNCVPLSGGIRSARFVQCFRASRRSKFGRISCSEKVMAHYSDGLLCRYIDFCPATSGGIS